MDLDDQAVMTCNIDRCGLGGESRAFKSNSVR